MAEIQIYLYANCSFCRNAEALLSASGIAYDLRDIFREPMTPDEIRILLSRIGKTPFEVLSRRSIPYRQLGLAERDPTEDEVIRLMSEHPGLLRRPIVIAGDKVLIGFRQRDVEQLIASIGAN